MLRRFEVGDRVLAKVDSDDDGWRAGTISQVDYREDDWSSLREDSPYQILLDSSCRFEKDYVHAPCDDDSVVRAIPKKAQDIPLLPPDKRKCCEAGETCPFHHVCDDKVNCPKFHFCGKEGRIKTRLWKKLAQRQLQKATEMCASCQNGVCEDPGEASIDAILEFVEGQHTQNTKRRTRKTLLGRRQVKKGAKSDLIMGPEVDKVENSPMEDKKDGVEPKEQLECGCDCHAVAALGRQAVIAMLREGMDFSSLFKEDLFETADTNSYEQEELGAFKWNKLVDEWHTPRDFIEVS
jgi:hypothetical protein